MNTAALDRKFTVDDLLGIEAKNTVELIQAIENGLSFGTLERVRRVTGLPMERLAVAVGISPRTLSRRRKTSKLKAWESDRLVSISRLLSFALELFEGDSERAVNWFVQPNRALGDVSPLEMAATETGAREIENLIGRLEHGVFS
ncbi:MAG TPA: antitoxin Xre/MbcA/ParS toxin-binding domain-containing protein [Pyrinomonadaceae bacterium]|jgi:putative toxin-antitoxin system antitoxin component (TIGR02293 family)